MPTWKPWRVLFFVFLILGVFLRLIDLTDPPLFFNPARQLRGTIIARDMYFAGLPDIDPGKREAAAEARRYMERLEPPILEFFSAAVFSFTGETIAVPRMINTAIWILGAVFLFHWAGDLAGPAGGLAALAYFLFLPFSIYASRAFLPEPAMVTWLIIAGVCLLHWKQEKTWKWALLAGLFGGFAVVTKVTAVFFAAGMGIGAVYSDLRKDLRAALKNPQVYTIAGLMLVPALLFLLDGMTQGSSSYLTPRTVFTRAGDVLDPSFYIRWLIRIEEPLSLVLVFLGFTGTLLAVEDQRPILWGLWGGYGLYGIFLPYHITTHDYYHLPLVFIVALSLAPLGKLVWDRVAGAGKTVRLAFALTALLGLFYPAWIARSVLVGTDFGDAPEYWELVGREIPDDGKAIGYSQDYGFRLMYYGWQPILVIPEGISAEEFTENYAGAHYFVVTAKNQLSSSLDDYLQSHYPIQAEGGGYVVYDLQP